MRYCKRIPTTKQLKLHKNGHKRWYDRNGDENMLNASWRLEVIIGYIERSIRVFRQCALKYPFIYLMEFPSK